MAKDESVVQTKHKELTRPSPLVAKSGGQKQKIPNFGNASSNLFPILNLKF